MVKANLDDWIMFICKFTNIYFSGCLLKYKKISWKFLDFPFKKRYFCSKFQVRLKNMFVQFWNKLECKQRVSKLYIENDQKIGISTRLYLSLFTQLEQYKRTVIGQYKESLHYKIVSATLFCWVFFSIFYLDFLNKNKNTKYPRMCT